MSKIRKCNIPDDLYYVVEKHIWARYDGELVTVGMTDVAQHLAQTFLSVTAKAVGRTVKKSKSIATVESSKWVGPVPSPVEGDIVEINASVVSQPTTINRDPYGEGWIARLRPADWAADSADLATGQAGVAAYEAFLVAEGIQCGDG
ncbi:MAG: glycine cleavage system protein GcvH [Aeromicrobium sp.]